MSPMKMVRATIETVRSGRRRRHLRALGDDHDPTLARAPPLLVLLEVEADLRAGGDLHVLVDDRPPDARVAADDHVLDEDALLDVAERVHADPRGQHAPVDAPAGDDAP